MGRHLAAPMRTFVSVALLLVAATVSPALACTLGYDTISVPGRIDSNITATTPTLADEQITTCGILAPARQGRWFYIDPSAYTAGSRLYITTCGFTTGSFDTVMMIFNNTSPTCTAGNVPTCNRDVIDSSTAGCDSSSFLTQSGRFYWVYVYSFNGSSGSFTFRVSSTPFPVCFDKSVSISSISQITTSSTTFISPSSSALTGGSSTRASIAYPSCLQIGSDITGNWYTFTGNGNSLSFVTCPSSGSSQGDTETHVYRYSADSISECNQLACVAKIDNNDPTRCDNTTISTQVGETIAFFVTSTVPDTPASYTWGWSQPRLPVSAPAASTCQFAETMTPNVGSRTFSLSSSTTSGLASNACPLGSSTLSTMRGSWYRLSGLSTTTTYYLSTCGSTTVDTEIFVFRSTSSCTSCSCLTCQAFNDDVSSDFISDCPLLSSITSFSPNLSSDTYLIFVGSTRTSGTIEFAVSTGSPRTGGAASSGSSVGAIIGGSIGGFFAFVIIIVIIAVVCSASCRAAHIGASVARPATATIVVQQQPQPVMVAQPQPIVQQTTTTYEMQPMQQQTYAQQTTYSSSPPPPGAYGAPPPQGYEQQPPGYYT